MTAAARLRQSRSAGELEQHGVQGIQELVGARDLVEEPRSVRARRLSWSTGGSTSRAASWRSGSIALRDRRREAGGFELLLRGLEAPWRNPRSGSARPAWTARPSSRQAASGPSSSASSSASSVRTPDPANPPWSPGQCGRSRRTRLQERGGRFRLAGLEEEPQLFADVMDGEVNVGVGVAFELLQAGGNQVPRACSPGRSGPSPRGCPCRDRSNARSGPARPHTGSGPRRPRDGGRP